mmetsp:Transcript_40181/g.46224  ORF Transcript_40181/g.46224 Transcript_40181/m.46224 type:complete len:265 (+) Transcript_40181:708-1502(+)
MAIVVVMSTTATATAHTFTCKLQLQQLTSRSHHYKRDIVLVVPHHPTVMTSITAIAIATPITTTTPLYHRINFRDNIRYDFIPTCIKKSFPIGCSIRPKNDSRCGVHLKKYALLPNATSWNFRMTNGNGGPRRKKWRCITIPKQDGMTSILRSICIGFDNKNICCCNAKNNNGNDMNNMNKLYTVNNNNNHHSSHLKTRKVRKWKWKLMNSTSTSNNRRKLLPFLQRQLVHHRHESINQYCRVCVCEWEKEGKDTHITHHTVHT